MSKKNRPVQCSAGTWFAVPLEKKGRYAVGVLARYNPRTFAFGYFFGPMRKTAPTLSEVGCLRAKDAILRGQFSDVGLVDKEWPIIGKVASWNRSHWPLPPFIILDDEEGKARMTVYSDDLTTMLSYKRCDPKLAKKYPEEGCMGHVCLQEVLTDLLDNRKAARARAALTGPDRAAGSKTGGAALTAKGHYASFESDDAADWVSELVDADDLTTLKRALDDVLAKDCEYIDLPAGATAIAAAEVVAALLGKPPRDLPEDVKHWAKDKPRPKAALIKQARSGRCSAWSATIPNCRNFGTNRSMPNRGKGP